MIHTIAKVILFVLICLTLVSISYASITIARTIHHGVVQVNGSVGVTCLNDNTLSSSCPGNQPR